ncbi:hypothetical protein HNY73_009507 [Argiope bruennichi]|uniref:Uncharacterized protein n=1 Tax=Argiope bruennichi TaxID=94029 RepID=A0A8T0FCB0_ARGBR|nr:hypothetical protein HNY73_009507 [Argiope bruennichi]
MKGNGNGMRAFPVQTGGINGEIPGLEIGMQGMFYGNGGGMGAMPVPSEGVRGGIEGLGRGIDGLGLWDLDGEVGDIYDDMEDDTGKKGGNGSVLVPGALGVLKNNGSLVRDTLGALGGLRSGNASLIGGIRGIRGGNGGKYVFSV